MIETTEIIHLTRQLSAFVLHSTVQSVSTCKAAGKRIQLFPKPSETAHSLEGRTITAVTTLPDGWCLQLDAAKFLAVRQYDGLVLYSSNHEQAPKNDHLQLQFTNQACLTVKFRKTGTITLFSRETRSGHEPADTENLSILDKAFTPEYLRNCLTKPHHSGLSLAAFIINSGCISGIGPVYLQDILFKAYLHPEREIGSLSQAEIDRLHQAVGIVMRSAIDMGGRNTEYDLLGKKGRYRLSVTGSRVGDPCPRCGELIEELTAGKHRYACCPVCQENSGPHGVTETSRRI